MAARPVAQTATLRLMDAECVRIEKTLISVLDYTLRGLSPWSRL